MGHCDVQSVRFSAHVSEEGDCESVNVSEEGDCESVNVSEVRD